jgi:TPR repeat protein
MRRVRLVKRGRVRAVPAGGLLRRRAPAQGLAGAQTGVPQGRVRHCPRADLGAARARRGGRGGASGTCSEIRVAADCRLGLEAQRRAADEDYAGVAQGGGRRACGCAAQPRHLLLHGPWRGEGREGRRWLARAGGAAQGCAGAQCTLGLITQDVKAAFVRFAKAAAQGSANAAFNLGLFFEQGCGATQDFKAAAKWFAAAAAKNVADAQYKLGCLLNTGVGVSQDSVAAATLFAKAAAQGHAGAQHNLGVAYFKGAGVALDFELADRWFRKAAAQGQWDAINALAKIQRARADAAAARPPG